MANHRKIAVRLVCYNASSITEKINGRGEVNSSTPVILMPRHRLHTPLLLTRAITGMERNASGRLRSVSQSQAETSIPVNNFISSYIVIPKLAAHTRACHGPCLAVDIIKANAFIRHNTVTKEINKIRTCVDGRVLKVLSNLAGVVRPSLCVEFHVATHKCGSNQCLTQVASLSFPTGWELPPPPIGLSKHWSDAL